MAHPLSRFAGQRDDVPFEAVARLALRWGHAELEIAHWGDHLDVQQKLWGNGYVAGKQATHRTQLTQLPALDGIRDDG